MLLKPPQGLICEKPVFHPLLSILDSGSFLAVSVFRHSQNARQDTPRTAGREGGGTTSAIRYYTVTTPAVHSAKHWIQPRFFLPIKAEISKKKISHPRQGFSWECQILIIGKDFDAFSWKESELSRGGYKFRTTVVERPPK